ncbi:hypothetical protein BRD00_05580 [Halobacteriales archaeon QS_8_69_26]|nr:MAG: hypothetical protein BRD00_05580 [Halobacteriales archaeon QS_8_69_26]
MRRRRLLGGIAAGLAGGLAGCTAFGSGDSGDPPSSDRPLVNERFVAGPTAPPCRSSGKSHYPPMTRRRDLIDEVPDSSDPAVVAALVRDNIRSGAPVDLRSDRYARLAWRDRVWNITDRWKSERHYVGEVDTGGGRHAVLVVVHATYTEVVHFETAENC